MLEIKLPASSKAAPAEATPAPRREVLIEGKVLLVENEEAVLEFERDVLAGAGARVTTFTNADDAKNRLKEETFDAVIIDGKMPGGWGAQEVCGWLAENVPGMEKKVLFTFSSMVEPEMRAFLQEKNLASLVKPFEVADLINQARKLLQKTHAAAAGGSQ